MNPFSLLEAVGQFFYWLIYLVNPEFREEEKIKEIERKQNQKLVLEIERKKNQEEKQKQFNENRLNKISNNIELIEICLDDPVFCDNNEILKEKLQEELKDPTRIKKYKDEWIKTFKNINYGCYCRNEINLNLYNNCPIDDNLLDHACKERQECLTSEGNFWVESSICNTKFLSFLETIPYSEIKNLESFSNEEILIFTANKYKALLKIQNELN